MLSTSRQVNQHLLRALTELRDSDRTLGVVKLLLFACIGHSFKSAVLVKPFWDWGHSMNQVQEHIINITPSWLVSSVVKKVHIVQRLPLRWKRLVTLLKVVTIWSHNTRETSASSLEPNVFDQPVPVPPLVNDGHKYAGQEQNDHYCDYEIHEDSECKQDQRQL